MKRGLISAAAMVCAAAWCFASDYKLEEREKVARTLSGASSIDVNNVNGFIHVTGDSGSTVRVEGEKIIRALDAGEMARAKREVTLDINQKDGVAQFYVNGPFRDHDRSSSDHGFHESESRHYEVTYNLTFMVPRSIAVDLKTVNGEIRCADTSGKFDVHGVNGRIAMTGIAGSGEVRTVNGTAAVSFRENPGADSRFQTVNGTLDIAFQPNLSAAVHVKTLNGAAYTDFEATALASAPIPSAEGGQWRLRRNHVADLKIGSGGPDLTFETVNGDIRIRKAQ